jgi:hypothetical protein
MLPSVTSIPRSLTEANGWRAWLLWAVFGNDDDGVCGERIPVGVQRDDDGYAFGADQPYDQAHFERWWKRNPAHNLTLHVLARPVLYPRYVIGKAAPQETAVPYAGERSSAIVLRFNPFFLKVGYFFIGWVSWKPRPNGGAFNLGFKDIT